MTVWVAVPVYDRGGMVQARLAVGQEFVDQLNAIDAQAWRMAAYGGTPGEFSANVETFAYARGVQVPDRSNGAYEPWKSLELRLWSEYVRAGLAEVMGDWSDVSRRARVLVVGFAEINQPLIANAERTRTQRTNTNAARSFASERPAESNSERGKAWRENQRRVRIGQPEMSQQERDSFIDAIRAEDTERANERERERTRTNALPTYLTNQPEDIANSFHDGIVPTDRYLEAAEHDRQIESDEKFLPGHLKTGADREGWRAQFESASPLHDTEHGDSKPTNLPQSASVATPGDALNTTDTGSQTREAVNADTAA